MSTGQVRQVPYALPYVTPSFSRWTADGQGILTFGRDLKGRQGIFRINVATGDTARVVFSDTCRGASQTTDGTGLFCVSADQATISRFDIASGSQRELVSGHTLEILGGSPDGKYLAFTEKHTGTKATSLKLLTLGSGEQKELLSVEAPESIFFLTFAWTPDSQSVVFQKQRSGRSSLEMWFASIDGRVPHKIDMPVTASLGWRFNPKTNQVAFGVGTGFEFEVWKIEKFLKAGLH
jgi:Tol biopolymer transport system component